MHSTEGCKENKEKEIYLIFFGEIKKLLGFNQEVKNLLRKLRKIKDNKKKTYNCKFKKKVIVILVIVFKLNSLIDQL